MKLKRDANGRFLPPEGSKEKPPTGKLPPGAAKRVMQKKVREAWPAITDMLVKTAQEGDFPVTRWLWDESGLAQEMPKKGTKKGFAQRMIEAYQKQQAEAEAKEASGE